MIYVSIGLAVLAFLILGIYIYKKTERDNKNLFNLTLALVIFAGILSFVAVAIS